MKKRIFAIVMAVIMVMSLVASAVPALAADDDITIRLHYSREDGIYEGWNVWFWPKGSDGSAHKFTEENGEMITTFKVSAGITEVG